MEYYSAIKRKAFESGLMRWMNLEPIIQSEVTRRNSRGEWSPSLPLETRTDSPGASGKQPRDPCPPGDEHYVLDTSLDKVSFALQ